jgi:hypothetical protein
VIGLSLDLFAKLGGDPAQEAGVRWRCSRRAGASSLAWSSTGTRCTRGA